MVTVERGDFYSVSQISGSDSEAILSTDCYVPGTMLNIPSHLSLTAPLSHGVAGIIAPIL